MSRQPAPHTVRSLLDAGQTIVAEQGTARLTLDAVAERAKLSKGALLHHFKSKDELSRRLMQDSIDEFDGLVERLRGADRTKGSFSKAYFLAVLQAPRALKSRLQVIAALAQEPKLRELYLQATRRWLRRMDDDGLDPAVVHLVRLAADGLWWNEAAACTPMDAKLRKRVSSMLLGLIG
jgi:AcrR family transcriptional regulator